MKYSILLFIKLCLMAGALKAQPVARNEDDKHPFPTQAIDSKPALDPKKQKPEEQRYLYIIKNNSKNTLKGNKCFEEVTHKYGFEYLIVPKDLPPNRNEFSRFIHNFGVKFILFFRNGPFWQLKMKKKYNQCKYRYGDFTG